MSLSTSTSRVGIALGSNLGDRRSHLSWAVDQLRRIVAGLRVSSFLETAPVGVPDAQPPYLNAAVAGTTELTPREMLTRLLALERERGRERARPLAARTLDLDIILFGDLQVSEPDLHIPHPRFRERRFVLEPLCEVASNWVDPGTGRTVKELLSNLELRT